MYGGGQGYGGGGGGGFQPPNYGGGPMPGYQGGVPMQPGMHPGMGMPMGMHPGMSMHPGATEFVPGNGYMQGTPGSSPYMQPGQQAIPRQKAHAPPTDEEQEWLEAQMDKGEEKLTDGDAENAALAEAAAAPVAPASAEPEGGYDDVMKMIEENRRKNEAKRAAQSARNAEITAAFEARMAGNGR